MGNTHSLINQPPVETPDAGAELQGSWEQRWHPLLQEWVIFSAHRQDRPWTGERFASQHTEQIRHDPDCYLCPGNGRISGDVNPEYSGVFVFDNDRPSISFDAPAPLDTPSGIYRNKPATGLTRVLCYSPLHNLTMAELNEQQVLEVVEQWQHQTRSLSRLSGITSVNIFENKGQLCGMSNPHPHGQIYATNFLYKTVESHLQAAQDHHRQTGQCLFQDILTAEQSDGRRIVAENDTMLAFVPYFARFAYEVYIAPKRTVAHVSALNDRETADLAALMRTVLVKMDNVWEMSFPYLMMLHQAPVDNGDYRLFHFHIELYPPLRTPELRKYVAAHEIGGGNFLADTMPEAKAAELRSSANQHYKTAGI